MNEENKDQRQPLSDQKKTALLRYMTILFAVAFVLVLLSWVLQSHNSQATITQLNQTSTNALENAEMLQQQNRDLQSDNAALNEQLTALQAELETQKEQAAQQDSADSEQLLSTQQQLDKTTEAYDALITAMACTTREGNVTFSKAMETLKTLYTYLSENALVQYQALLGE